MGFSVPRLLAKITQTESCWAWIAGKDKDGYGKVDIDGKTRPAHRVVYELFVGTIAPGLELDHLCKNTSCVNPSHLEPVTRAENAWRNSLCKITKNDSQKIREYYKQGYKQKEIGKMFSIGQDQVSRIVNNKAWSTE